MAITGLGVLSGAGLGVAETVQNLFDSNYKLKSLMPENEISKISVPIQADWFEKFSVARETSHVNLLTLAAAYEAIASAGLSLEDLKKNRVGVCLGSTVGCSSFNFDFTRDFDFQKFPDPSHLLAHFKNNVSQYLNRHLGLHGPSLMLSNACTSGADAIGMAASWLRADLCDIVICGGVEVILPQIFFGFKSMQLCSPKRCQPFDRDRQGLTLGEGAGLFILEKLNSRREHKAKLLGYASGSDAYHPTAPHPEARGLNLALAQIFKSDTKAQDKERKIDFINAHGTATPHNDLAEGRWIKNNFPNAAVVATKAYTGHTLAAAGGIEAVLTVLSLIEQKLPQSKGFLISDPEINLTPTTEIISGSFHSALSLSLGFGGTNSILHLGRA